MKAVYIGLGSNMGDRIKAVRQALARLDREPDIDVCRVSSYFLTAPQGYEQQAWFVNAVAEIETALTP
ncbi:MAG: 2-amino-4-hydroxy-6-hydroxymethyldihydropteridine diphosphokinase, partial [bacterium]|nr:2-amino-4-hydroxy-6-hydroxymethyldihydropteridine diphosphokinase [bacterium]